MIIFTREYSADVINLETGQLMGCYCVSGRVDLIEALELLKEGRDPKTQRLTNIRRLT